MLRDFFYLNESSINDYLSQLQGYVEDEIEVSDSHVGRVKGGISTGVQIGGEADHNYGTKKTARVSYTDKFNRVYDLAKRQVKRTVKDVKKSSLCEFEGSVTIPEMVQSLSAISGLVPNASSLMAEEILKQSEPQPEYMNSVLATVTDRIFDLQSFPVFIKPSIKHEGRLFARLEKQWIRREATEWQNRELAILAKVAKVIPSGYTQRIGLISDIETITGLSRHQKKALDEKATDGNDLAIDVHGPALEVRIIAIWE